MIAANQGRTFLKLFEELSPFFRTDRNLPTRIQQRLGKEKKFGSRDRRLYRELIYTAARFLPWIETLWQQSQERALNAVVWLAESNTATQALKQSLPSDWPSLPSSVAEKAAFLEVTGSLFPEWFRLHCPAAFEPPEIDILHTRAPLWLRLQTENTGDLFNEFMVRGWKWKTFPDFPHAVQLLTDADVTTTDAYQQGMFEVQDLGSQLILDMVRPQSGSHWLDACAGAGGKTLQLANMVGASGKVSATDPRHSALEELRTRAKRAGLQNIHVRQHRPAPDALYDGVLVDAPCSGTGTWRRSPHLKWCTSEADVLNASHLQYDVLTQNAHHVRPGGLLVYATCSLSTAENAAVIEKFIDATPVFELFAATASFAYLPEQFGTTIFPARNNTDGFFVSVLRRK
ncbi:MAG: RsmB/NOP family class I SAM-dependent RNA methyltransferase [Nibricoccus sp.]